MNKLLPADEDDDDDDGSLIRLMAFRFNIRASGLEKRGNQEGLP
jgi:hypothetical protein